MRLLQYKELLIYLPSEFFSKIIYCNKYVQRAYDLWCNYCDTHNYYYIYLASSAVKKITAISIYSVLMIYVVIIAIHRINTLSTYNQFCCKIIYCNKVCTSCLWFMLQVLQYTELLLYLPSQFCHKIIYYNEYVQRAYYFM